MTVLKPVLFKTQALIKRNSILNTNNSSKSRLFVSFKMNVKAWTVGISQQRYGCSASALVTPHPEEAVLTHKSTHFLKIFS